MSVIQEDCVYFHCHHEVLLTHVKSSACLFNFSHLLCWSVTSAIQANRSVTTIVKEALGHSQRNGWLVAAVAQFLLWAPLLAAYAVLPVAGTYTAGLCYMYGYLLEAVVMLSGAALVLHRRGMLA